ncbi:uncharacterized protein LOC119635306 isoform X2 [Glossina fuscipes]|uniref:Uncharacterized protein LOC119635306 isoform X2 n=1 Tax=Glossina fuscipes TaxID=7396 RepID=A0A8U0WK79_9MUSC|nr:uncharacterized protein LOC119635306 isoform X2 [Glossina fuscipes]
MRFKKSPRHQNATVLEELLSKLEIEHVTWTTSKKGYFHHVVFPLQSGDPCETTLHCLTELGIGTKLHSSVSVLPCSVSYDSLTINVADEVSESLDREEELSRWNSFVDSIKSKLTVKQVVDGVRAGGSLSFDYILLIVTADSLAALGLVENNAPNITAAMLVSPLMGPVMSITFGTIISDRELMRVGFISLAVGMFLSCLFGFIFGLILGTTEMPWGAGDWPTEEMRGRGNVRSLWMGVLWALTSGTGVAVALLQGSAGPLIGVAISASLLPPVVNCGLFWALACIWLIYPGTRIPHLKGELHNTTSAYPFLYTDYLPTEFLINGIVSCLLTVVNVICIFITAIMVLKIKEVSAPYTASPDLKRFWETDLRTVRKTNRSTIRQRKGNGNESTFRDKLLYGYEGTEEQRNALEQALKEAEDDATFKKVKRMSYSSNAAGELTQRLAKLTGLNKQPQYGIGTNTPSRVGSTSRRMSSVRGSKLNIDLKVLDKLVTNLLEQQSSPNTNIAQSATGGRKSSLKLSRWRPTSRSAHCSEGSTNYIALNDQGEAGNNNGIDMQHMPTIMESPVGNSNNNQQNQKNESSTTTAVSTTPSNRTSWSNSSEHRSSAVRNVLRNITSSGSGAGDSAKEETLNLTQNFLP